MGHGAPIPVSTKLQRIAELARRRPGEALTTLAHHIDLAFLQAAFKRTRKDGAVGVDGQTAAEYAEHLEDNLQSLLDGFKLGTYKAPPVRRVHIPKDKGKTRPIGIPTFEDKVLQRAVQMVLEAVYEQDFLDCSYAFRPGVSPHAALDRLRQNVMRTGGGWVIELDIQSYFDKISHGHLRSFLDQRVRDGVLRRMIDKWLKAGVLESGQLRYSDEGTPQGGVISPILSNIYLHHVLDVWFTQDVRPALRGTASLVRFADDAVLVFATEADARKALAMLPIRFEKYGLTLHPDKTRLLDFRSPQRGDVPPRKGGPPATGGTARSFDFLGFRHYWGKSRTSGRWVVKGKTSPKSFSRSLHKVGEWLKRSYHFAVAEQHRSLCRKLIGHANYFKRPGNAEAVHRFRHEVGCLWRKWLGRRHRRGRLTWDRFNRLLQRYPLRLSSSQS